MGHGSAKQSGTQSAMNRLGRGRVALGMLASSALLLGGCNTAQEGAVGGAFIGALSGLAIGALSGNEGDGVVIGAVSGAVIGGAIGDQNERNSRGHYPPPRPRYDDGYHHAHPHHHGGYHRDPWWERDCDW